MRRVVIIGASGSLAAVVIDTLKKHDVIALTLFARNKKRIANAGELPVIEGDALNYADIKKAVEGQDIVYVNLAGNLEAMGRNIIKAMKESGVKRIIAISSIGIYKTPLSSVLVPYRALADVVEESGLDYTIIRPDWFTSGSEVDYHITHKPAAEVGGALSRKSIAAFVALLVESPDTYLKDNVGISK